MVRQAMPYLNFHLREPYLNQRVQIMPTGYPLALPHLTFFRDYAPAVCRFNYLLVAAGADDGPASNRPLFDADSPALGSSNLSIITFRFSSLTLFSLPLVSLPALDSGAGEPDLELKKFLARHSVYSFHLDCHSCG